MGKFRNVFKKFLGFEEEETSYDFEASLSRQKEEEESKERVNNQTVDPFEFNESIEIKGIDKRTDRRENFAQIYNEFEQPKKRLEELLIKPKDFSDACTIVERIAEGNVVVMDLEQLDIDTCKRISDFVLGAVFVMQGDVQKISSRVFRFSVDEES